MRHLKAGRKLKRTASHRRALLCNLATALFEHKKITTTEAKAKELRPFAEDLMTKAKNAIARERQGGLPEGQKIDVHARRVVARAIRSKAVLQELFDTIAPTIFERPGGYTRIIKLGERRGDAGREAVIELVDWSAAQDGATSTRRAKKPARKPAAAKTAPKAPAAAPVESDADSVNPQITDTAEEAIPTSVNDQITDSVESDETPAGDTAADASNEAANDAGDAESNDAADATDEPKA